jgi:hypothetical protein
MDVEEHRARGVGDVGGVHASAGEVPHQPGVDRAEGELAALGARPRSVDTVEQPAQLRSREIGVDQQTGTRLHERFVLPQLVAQFGGAAVLPDDGVVNRLAGGAVPHHRRLALVGDADRRELDARHARDALVHHRRLRLPDLTRIVLDPARPRIELPEFALRDRHHLRALVEQQRARAGGALVECEDGFHRGGLYGPRGSRPTKRPGTAPVTSPPLTTTRPFTSTQAMPSGRAYGSL